MSLKARTAHARNAGEYTEAKDSGRLEHQPEKRARAPRRGRSCCVCFGINCGLFFKVLGLICVTWLMWTTYRLVSWFKTFGARSESEVLANMPAFGTFPACQSATTTSQVYQSFKSTIGNSSAYHIAIQGGTFGTITLAGGTGPEVLYEVVLGALDGKDVSIEASSNDTSFLIQSQTSQVSDFCQRFDVTVRIPTALKSLTISSDSSTHIQVAADAKFDINSLSIHLRDRGNGNVILAENMRAGSLALEVSRGFIYGTIPLVQRVLVKTLNGDGASFIRVIPDNLIPGYLHTEGGTGITDVTFAMSEGGLPHQPIHSTHTSRRGDMYLTYSGAEFSGTVDLDAASHTSTHLNKFEGDGPSFEKSGETPRIGEESSSPRPLRSQKTMRWAGSPEGKDTMIVKTPGWAGLYF